MEETKDWNRFTVTGKVEDYLKYKGVYETTSNTKESTNAELRASDRNGYQDHSCR